MNKITRLQPYDDKTAMIGEIFWCLVHQQGGIFEKVTAMGHFTPGVYISTNWGYNAYG